MKRFALLLAIIILTGLAFWPITDLPSHGDQHTSTLVFGIPALGVMSERFCWLSIGMGTGVLFIGFLGAGIVCIALGVGAGALFGIGQGTCGLIAIGQVAIGGVFSFAQLGTGAAGLGQLILGILVKGQVSVGKDGGGFLKALNEDLNRELSFR